jgi:galactokinase
MLQDSGLDLPGADLVITGDLPLRAGLSSSASLEMAVGVAMCELAGTRIDPLELARLGRRAENEILGVQSGLMDQLAVACGRQGHALLIDCRTAAVEPVAVPDRARFLVLDTGVRRRLSDSAYNRRRAECALALRKLQTVHPEVLALRDATIEMLIPNGNLLDEVELRRVSHVVTEDDRVLRAAETLGRGDLEEFGRLMTASHVSLRDDFEVSSPELDVMVEAALSHPRVLGARLTGAGFGGCAVALVDSAQAEHASESIAEAYCRRTGRAATIYVCEPSEGASVIGLK